MHNSPSLYSYAEDYSPHIQAILFVSQKCKQTNLSLSLSLSAMSSATLDPPSSTSLSISTVDLRLLSQSDLFSLSLSSSSSLSLSSSSSDVVVPQINRSVFNESAGSRKQTYSRLRLAPRLPSHLSLSSSPHNLPSLEIPDPESSENSLIISLLKSLLSGTPPADVSLPQLPQNPPISTGEKRKRGRPRRNPNPNPDFDPNAESSADPVRKNAKLEKGIFLNKKKADGGNAGRDREMRNPNPNPNFDPNAESNADPVRKKAKLEKGIFLNKKKAEGDAGRDRERVNGKGVEVDFDEVARLEDPYKGELERRSVGLRTEEEFLGFLGGLEGQWGSRRKKKRVVEADVFGDVLPRGWKLLLSCKKKEGRVWLDVRRYISPNGRHFMSCKEVASYLLSLFGLEDANQQPIDQSNNNVQPSQGVINGRAADSAINDNKESVKMESNSPSLVISIPDQKQIAPVIGNSGDIQADNVLRCDKCNLSFDGKDDFMHHQLSTHRRRRSKFGSSITDGVIIVDGQYECQFCHKRFVERHRYNGHVGAHKRHHLKNDEGSPLAAMSLPSGLDLESPHQVHPKESSMHESTGDDSDSATAYRFDGQPKHVSSDSARNVGSDTEVFTEQRQNKVNNLPRDEQESQSNTNAHSLAEQHCLNSNADRMVNNYMGNIDEAGNLAASRFSTSLEPAVPMSIDEIDNNGDLVASDFEDYRPSPTAHDNISGNEIITNDVSVSAADASQQADSKIISLAPQGNLNTCNVDEDDINLPLETSKLERSEFKVDRSHSPSLVPIGNEEGHIITDDVDMVSSSALPDSKQKRFSESDEEVMFGYKEIYAGCNPVSNPESDIPHNSEEDVMIGHEKSAICLNIPSQTDELGDMADHRTNRNSEIVNASFDAGNIARREMERPNINETQIYRSNEVAFGISHHQIVRPEVRRPEFGVPFLSGHQQIFSDEKTSGANSLLSQQKSNLDNSFRTEYCLGNPFSDVYTMNTVANSSREVPKPDAVLNSGNSELMIDFGNSGSGIVANPMDNVPMEQIFFEIDRSRERCRTGDESKQESNLLGSSYYSKPGGSENYLDRIDTGSVWDGPILDGAADFGHDKLMIGFSNSGGPSHVDPMGANMWRTDERNTFQSALAAGATQHVGSSSFLNANMMPDKDDDMFLGYNGVQAAAPEHIEFSFMTPHSIDSFPRHPKTMYNSTMGQGFDSSFWLEKDDLSLNIAARNLVTSICVWCRNEFRHEPDNSGTQNGAIGSICPTCSARVSQQFNAF